MIEIKKILDKKGLKNFIQFRYDLYRDDENDVPYLYSDEMFTLSKDKNASFDDCEADYFMAYRDGKPVGRVAAIINHKANERWKKNEVRFGWFDFVDDIEVSKALLLKVEEWGRERGMDSMIGPMGFADTDREGMLIEGFSEYSTAYANYNYSYYPRHMEQIGGFEKDNDWVQCQVKVPEAVPEKFGKIAEMVGRRYNLKVHKLSRKELMKEGYGREVFQMLNVCYGNLYGFASLGERKVDQLVDQYIRIADLNLVSIIVEQDGGFRHHFPFALQGTTQTEKRPPVSFWMDRYARCHQMASCRYGRYAAHRRCTRIPGQGCQCAYIQRPHSAVYPLWVQVG